MACAFGCAGLPFWLRFGAIFEGYCEEGNAARFFPVIFFSLRAGRRLWRVFSKNLADIGLTCVIFPAFGNIFLDGRSSDFFWHGFRPWNCCKFRILTLPSLPGFQKKQFRLWSFDLGPGLAAVQLSILIVYFCPSFFFLKITAKQRLNQFPCSSPTVSAQEVFWKFRI